MLEHRAPARINPDGLEIQFGGVSSIHWETADPNANYLAVDLPAGGGVDVPVVLAGIAIDAVDLGLFNGVAQPTLGIVDADRDTALVLDFSGDDAARIRTTAGDLTIAPTGDIVLAPTGGDTTFGTSTGNAQIDSAVGGASNPVYTFVGDEDSGFTRTGANQIEIHRGGNRTIIFTDGGEMHLRERVLVVGARMEFSQGSDAASSDEVTLGDGNYFDITGTTTINHITKTNWQAGSIVVLQFDGSVTVTHNSGSVSGTEASILLAGAANFDATASDTLTLVYDGTTFREIARTVI